mgnify:FL=1
MDAQNIKEAPRQQRETKTCKHRLADCVVKSALCIYSTFVHRRSSVRPQRNAQAVVVAPQPALAAENQQEVMR